MSSRVDMEIVARGRAEIRDDVFERGRFLELLVRVYWVALTVEHVIGGIQRSPVASLFSPPTAVDSDRPHNDMVMLSIILRRMSLTCGEWHRAPKWGTARR
jgi:hypothetical protein